MIKEQHLEIWDKTVRKNNDLIQKSRYSLTVQEHKVILYLIAHIDPWDEELKTMEFDIQTFCRTCGIEETNGGNYKNLKDTIRGLREKSIGWIDVDDDETLIGWIERPFINKGKGIVRIRLDEYLQPYLLRLRKNFTQYELIYTLKFRSRYTFRLYELVQSRFFNKLEPYVFRYNVDKLKNLIDADTYTEYRDFKRRALVPAVNEICEYSDTNLKFEEIKQGRKVKEVEFTISVKPPMERIKIKSRIEKELGTSQMTLFDLLKEKGEVNEN